jgi:hypothetical protein
VSLAPIVFVSLRNITGATLATCLRERKIDDVDRQPPDHP